MDRRAIINALTIYLQIGTDPIPFFNLFYDPNVDVGHETANNANPFPNFAWDNPRVIDYPIGISNKVKVGVYRV